jgi:predicted nuclease of restriction endonuclease-like (RecB) superfamily
MKTKICGSMDVSNDYKSWIVALKDKVRSSQIKAAIAVNSALIAFYWELGRMISEKENVWGSKLLERVAKDLKDEFPEMTGFSVRNLKYCRTFYKFYTTAIGQQAVALIEMPNDEAVKSSQQSNSAVINRDESKREVFENKKITIVQQLVAQIPWGHNIFIFTRSNDLNEALYYVRKTMENNWSRDVLDLQIKSNLYSREGKSINNFESTLPKPLSDLANQTLKDPYIFEFLSLSEKYREKDIENQLIHHISKFLLELGKGFAYVGNQYLIKVAENEYYIDLLFYHIKLKCYIVVELKNTRFIPEFAGKLNFYLSAVDSLVKEEADNPTIGMLLCKNKNNLEVEFALRDMKKPIGVSEIKLVESLPENLKSSLPTIEEIEREFKTDNFG